MGRAVRITAETMKSESQQEDKQSSKVKCKDKNWQVADRGKWTEEQLLIQR